MGQIAATVGQAADATLYTSTAQRYSNEVIAQAMATTKDHLKLSYGSSDDTWSTLYNLLPDKVFGLNLFSDAFYAMQGAWYAKQASKLYCALSRMILLIPRIQKRTVSH